MSEFDADLRKMGLDPNMFREMYFGTWRENVLKDKNRVNQLIDRLVDQKVLQMLLDQGYFAERKSMHDEEVRELFSSSNQKVSQEMEVLRSQKLSKPAAE